MHQVLLRSVGPALAQLDAVETLEYSLDGAALGVIEGNVKDPGNSFTEEQRSRQHR
jgi:hypothetical protein